MIALGPEPNAEDTKAVAVVLYRAGLHNGVFNIERLFDVLFSSSVHLHAMLAVGRMYGEPGETEPYKLNGFTDGGFEDPRVTYARDIDLYLMTYTGYGPQGPRTMLASSPDMLTWERLGLASFIVCRADLGEPKSIDDDCMCV